MNNTIYEILNNFILRALKRERLYCEIGTVVSVANNVVAYTTNKSSVQQEAQLGVIGNNESFILIPEIGSKILIAYTNKENGYTVWVQKASEILFNGGLNDGLVKVNELVTKLNIIESDLNDLKQAFSTWVVVPSDGGAALKTITSTWYGNSIEETTKEDIENIKIKQ